jgi:hypothetical protein
MLIECGKQRSCSAAPEDEINEGTKEETILLLILFLCAFVSLCETR